MIVWFLVGCLFMLMFLRIGLPFGVRTEGNVSAKVALTFRERLLLHRTNMYALGAILVLSAIGQWFPTTIEIVLILVALSIINLPIRYLFSTQGIACNNVLFRNWKEFAYVTSWCHLVRRKYCHTSGASWRYSKIQRRTSSRRLPSFRICGSAFHGERSSSLPC